uniref:Putative secreted collagen-like peptide n=1 Tax=Ixodes scapularis TaxID=6945 RepID=Q4PN68_IXOSC|nr:putative secreted collagen-like peptide [Ixodes scapularis]
MKSTLVAICFLLAVVHTMVEVVGGNVEFDIHSTGGGISGHNQGPQTEVEDTGESGQAGPPAPPGGRLPGLSGQAGAPSPGR